MDTKVIAERVARSIRGELSGGLWDYQKLMWNKVTMDLSKALGSAFGSNGRPDFVMAGVDSAYVTVKGYTRSDFALQVTVHVISKGNRYILSVKANRPDWGKYDTTVIDEEHSFSDFDVRKIARRVMEQTV